VSAQERVWQPGDEADVRVSVDDALAVPGPNDHRWVTVVGTTISTAVPERLLRPVSGVGVVEAATDDTIERAAEVIHGRGHGPVSAEEMRDDRACRMCEESRRVARALAAAGLLVGGVPGRSEAEIKAEALREAARALWPSRQPGREVRGPGRALMARAAWLEMDEKIAAARVAGTTEAGDDRG